MLLDSMAPALAMGLPPSRALVLAAGASTTGDESDSASSTSRRGFSSRKDVSDLERLAGALTAAAERGAPLAQVWHDWGRQTRSREISFVASAWALSSGTAPLSQSQWSGLPQGCARLGLDSAR